MSSLSVQDVDLIGRLNEFRGADIPSAATTDIAIADGNLVHVTGTTTIVGLGTAPQAGLYRVVIFDGALTLTHDVAKIKLPGGVNITTEAGDKAIFVSDTTAIWECVSYTRATGATIAADAIDTANITNLAVTTAKLAVGAVTTAKITALNVTATEIANNAVTTAKILAANVTEAELADNSVSIRTNRSMTVVALADTVTTLTASQLVNSSIFTAVPTAARIQTTDTAVNIIAAVPSFAVGMQVDFAMINTAAFTETIAAGVGVTLVGDMVTNNSSATFKILMTAAATVSIFRVT